MSKLIKLEDAVKQIENGMTLGIGGNVLHRTPMAFVRELVRQQKKNLRIVKTAGGHDVDLLCAGGCVATVDAGFVSYETMYGLAPYYRKAVQEGIVKANEHACYTVMSALRAAMAGVSFMPVKGLIHSDLIKVNDYFKIIKDPFTGEDITIVRAIYPDYAIIHVQECDDQGNSIILGPKYDDVLLSLSSKKVIITTEKIISNSKIRLHPEVVDIPSFLVQGIVVVNRGAAPCSCDKLYDIDDYTLKTFIKESNNANNNANNNVRNIEKYMKKYEFSDRQVAMGVNYYANKNS